MKGARFVLACITLAATPLIAIAAPGDPRLVNGVLEWPRTVTNESFVIVRGDDGVLYYVGLAATRRDGTVTAGARVAVLGIEGRGAHEITAVGFGSGATTEAALAQLQGARSPAAAAAPAPLAPPAPVPAAAAPVAAPAAAAPAPVAAPPAVAPAAAPPAAAPVAAPSAPPAPTVAAPITAPAAPPVTAPVSQPPAPASSQPAPSAPSATSPKPASPAPAPPAQATAAVAATPAPVVSPTPVPAAPAPVVAAPVPPAPGVVPTAATSPKAAVAPPAVPLSAPMLPVDDRRWTEVTGEIEAFVGRTVVLKVDGGRVTVDVSSLSGNLERMVAPGTKVKFYGVPVELRFKAMGFIDPDARGRAR